MHRWWKYRRPGLQSQSPDCSGMGGGGGPQARVSLYQVPLISACRVWPALGSSPPSVTLSPYDKADS